MVEINVIGGFNAVLENKFNKDIKAVKPNEKLLINITSHGGDVEVLKRMTASILALKNKGVEVRRKRRFLSVPFRRSQRDCSKSHSALPRTKSRAWNGFYRYEKQSYRSA